jgi:hypothetical protein
MQTLEDCGVTLTKANARAEAHNIALDACRATMPPKSSAAPRQ